MSKILGSNWLIKIELCIAVFAGTIFNNWILGVILNRSLFLHAGSVSEFSAAGQPYSNVFRALDITAGLLLVVLAFLLYKRLNSKDRQPVLPISLAIFGIANITDAIFTLNCSETLNSTCSIPVHVSLANFTLPSHAYSSIVIGVGYLALPLLGYFYGRSMGSKRLKLVSIIAIGIAAASLISIMVGYSIQGTFSEKAWGPSQEVQMLIMGAWFVALADSVFGKKQI